MPSSVLKAFSLSLNDRQTFKGNQLEKSTKFWAEGLLFVLSKVWLHLPLKHIMLFTVQQDNLTLVMVFEWVNRLIAMCNNRIIQLIRRKLNIPVNHFPVLIRGIFLN